jgi:type IV secretory pathway VirB6-like protein
MPQHFALFAWLYTAVATPLHTASLALIPAIQGWVGYEFKLCVGAYLICMLMIAGYSGDDSAALRFFRALYLAAIIYAIAATQDAYATYVTGMVHASLDGLSGKIMGAFGAGNAPITAASFDAIAIKVFVLGLSMVKGLGWSDLGAIIVLGLLSILYMGCCFVAIVIIFIVYALAGWTLDFIFGFGSIFVAFYFFPFTRSFFFNWVGTVLQVAFTQLLGTALLTVLVVALDKEMQDMAAAVQTAKDAPGSGNIIVQLAIMAISSGGTIAGVMFLTLVAAVLAAHWAGSAQMGLMGMSSRVLGSLGGLGSGAFGGSAAPEALGSNAGPAGGGGSGGSSAPSRQYAFQHATGSTP